MGEDHSARAGSTRAPARKIPDIDLADCVCCQGCEELCPDVFRLNPAGYMEILYLEEYPWERIEEAMAKCPKDCIFIIEL